MSAHTIPNGSEVAVNLRDSSEYVAYSTREITTLQDLVDHVRGDHNAAMFHSTARKFAEFKGKPCQDINVESLESERPEFRNYLREHKYATNSVRSYSNFANMLLAHAKRLGWKPSEPEIPAEWISVMRPGLRHGCLHLIRHFIRKGCALATVQESDLCEWASAQVRSGRSYATVYKTTCQLRRVLVEGEFNTQLSTKKVGKAHYGISYNQMPSAMREEMNDILRWKQDSFVPGRPAKAHVRRVSGLCLENALRRLIGFAINVRQIKSISSLRDVITESIVGDYVNWILNTRGLKNRSIYVDLGRISAGLGRNPRFASITGSWLTAMLACIPRDSDEEIRRRKEEKYLSHETLREIVGRIRLDRLSRRKASARTTAKFFRNELVLEWMLTLPWRQRNLRECRIGGESPNIFKAAVPSLASISRPDWLLELEKRQPGAAVWQVHFTKHETKTHHEVRFVLPRRLVEMLEEYLSVHRKQLIKGSDPGTLFINDQGSPFTIRTFGPLVSTLTLRYGGRAVTPHLFRDIYAFMWLKKVPEDYLTLSKLLWHRNIQTTIQKYGWMCNESSAVCRAEKILDL